MKSSRVKWFVFCVWSLCLAASAQELDLIGNTGWEKVGSRIRIHAERIENNRPEGTSGRLRLQIWATTNIYDEVGSITGYVLATLNLRPLPAGSAFVDIRRTVHAHHPAPPPGLYYTTITLEEETMEGFVIIDSENFAGLVNLGGFGEGIATLDSNGQNDITYVGDVSWSSGNKRVQLYAQDIRNERASGRSGTLRVRLWATEIKYAGGDSLVGYPMAKKRVGRLYAQSDISFFPRLTSFRPPPPGEWFVTMTLEEFDRGWNIVDYVTFDGQSLF